MASDGIHTPVKYGGQVSWPPFRYGSHTSTLVGTAEGDWEDVLFGAGNGQVSQVVPVASRVNRITVTGVGGKTFIINNVGADNPAIRARIRGRIFIGEAFRIDRNTNPYTTVPANDYGILQTTYNYEDIQLQIQTPSGTPVAVEVQFTGQAWGS